MRSDPRIRLFVLLIPTFMALVSVSVVNVGLAAIGSAIDADSTQLQWVVAGYTLTFGLVLVPAGRIGDATGRRRMFLLGIVMFTLGATLTGLASCPESINIARIIQGVGAGMVTPQTSAIIQSTFNGKRRAMAFATMGTTVAIATALGPVIGGVLLAALGDDWGWRWMFLMNLPLGLLAIALGAAVLPDDKAERSPGRSYLDPVGVLLLAAAVLSFMLPFLQRSGGWQWALIPLALVLLAAFVRWEAHVKDRGKAPLVDIAAFSDQAFRNGITIISVHFAGSTSIWLVMAVFLQIGAGYTALNAATVSLIASICNGVGAQLAGRYVLDVGRTMVIIGQSCVIVGLLGFIALATQVADGSATFLWFLLPAAFVGFGQGMTVSPNTTLTLQAADTRHAGVAGGLLSLGQRMGSAVGIAIIPGILFSVVEADGAWADAFRLAVAGIVTTTALALTMSIVDRRREARARK